MDVIDILGRGDLPAAVPAERAQRAPSRANSAPATEADDTRFSRELNSAVSSASNTPAPAAPASKTPVPPTPAVPASGPVESTAAVAVGDEAPPESLLAGDVGGEVVAPLPLLVLPTIVAPAENLDAVLPEVDSTETEGELPTEEPATAPPAFLSAMAAAMNSQRPQQIVAPVESAVAEGGMVTTAGSNDSPATSPVALTTWLSKSLGVTPEPAGPTEALPPISTETIEIPDEAVSTAEAAPPVVPAEQMTAALPVAATAPPVAPAPATTPVVTTSAVASPQPVASAPAPRPPEVKSQPESSEQPATQQPNIETRSQSLVPVGSSTKPSGPSSPEPVTEASATSGVSAAARDATESLAAATSAADGTRLAEPRSTAEQNDLRTLGATNSAAPVAGSTESAPVLPAGTISPSDQQFAERLSQYILQSQDQDQQLSVKITPPDLGTIVIRVQAGADGLSVEMEASNASTQQLLTDQLPHLQDALSQMGRPAERIDILRHETAWEAGAQGERGAAGGSQQSFAERREAPPAPRIVIPNPRTPPTDTAAATPPSGGPRLMQELNVKI